MPSPRLALFSGSVTYPGRTLGALPAAVRAWTLRGVLPSYDLPGALVELSRGRSGWDVDVRVIGPKATLEQFREELPSRATRKLTDLGVG